MLKHNTGTPHRAWSRTQHSPVPPRTSSQRVLPPRLSSQNTFHWPTKSKQLTPRDKDKWGDPINKRIRSISSNSLFRRNKSEKFAEYGKIFVKKRNNFVYNNTGDLSIIKSDKKLAKSITSKQLDTLKFPQAGKISNELQQLLHQKMKARKNQLQVYESIQLKNNLQNRTKVMPDIMDKIYRFKQPPKNTAFLLELENFIQNQKSKQIVAPAQDLSSKEFQSIGVGTEVDIEHQANKEQSVYQSPIQLLKYSSQQQKQQLRQQKSIEKQDLASTTGNPERVESTFKRKKGNYYNVPPPLSPPEAPPPATKGTVSLLSGQGRGGQGGACEEDAQGAKEQGGKVPLKKGNKQIHGFSSAPDAHVKTTNTRKQLENIETKQITQGNSNRHVNNARNQDNVRITFGQKNRNDQQQDPDLEIVVFDNGSFMANSQMSSQKSEIIPTFKTSQSQKQDSKQIFKKKFFEKRNNLNIVGETGVVANYCFKKLKKYKLNWFIPAVLIFKECQQFYKQYLRIQTQAVQLGFARQQQLSATREEIEAINKNLTKIIGIAQKKNSLPQNYLNLVSSENYVELAESIQNQTINFVNEVLASSQNNQFTLTAALMMVSSVCNIAYARGHNIQFYNIFEEKIDDDAQKIKAIKKRLNMIKKENLQF